jgi:hypothetical protein
MPDGDIADDNMNGGDIETPEDSDRGDVPEMGNIRNGVTAKCTKSQTT